MEYRLANEDDSIKEIFELVYDSDPVIYRDLFGEFKSGLEVYKLLYKNKDSIFYKDNYRIALSDDKRIIGVCTNYDKHVRWNPDVVKTAFLIAGVKIPESFYAVSHYFTKTYNYSHLQVAACNVCVRKEYRGQGVGSFMMANLLDEAGNNDIQLSVLKTNKAAINLYEKFGFKIIEEFNDYGGYNQPDLISYQMYRMTK